MTGDSAAGQTTALTLGEVVRAALPDFAHTHRLPAHHWQVLRALAACHTAALGGHQYHCTHCGRPHFVHCGHPALVLIRVIDRPKAPTVWDTS